MNCLDQHKAHQYYFEEMTKIPHGSFHEKGYSDYLVAFAQAHGLDYVQDEMNNVIIYAPASSGYEQHETVILQAHMDMVCEKEQNVDFDFAHEALKLYIEDGWLKAKGTTLGADDGCGIAYILAVLDSDLPHPPLECIFTVQEEVGLCGAIGLDPALIHGRRLINLDGSGEVSTCTTSAGGANVISELTIDRRPAKDPVYRLAISGLSGGHSGEAIHLEKGNANKLTARVLKAIADAQPIALAAIAGGMKDNAIPRDASALFSTSLPLSKLKEIVSECERTIKKELEDSDRDVTITVEEAAAATVMSAENTMSYLHFMTLLPHGVHHRSMAIEGLTTASMNAAVVTCDEHKLTVNCSVRGALESYIDTIIAQIELLADTFGFVHHGASRYPAWSYDACSPMRETLQRVFKERYHQDLELIAIHGGLECGVFKAMDPEMDIVTMGPVAEAVHTPNEHLDIASFDRTYDLLCAYLKEL